MKDKKKKKPVPYIGKPVDDFPQDYLGIKSNDLDLIEDDFEETTADEYNDNYYEDYA
jgi:hypothetical protein